MLTFMQSLISENGEKPDRYYLSDNFDLDAYNGLLSVYHGPHKSFFGVP